MTIGTTNRNDATGNDATTVYAYGFKIFAATDLEVTIKDTSGNETLLVYPTAYSVSGVGLAAGGNVTLTDLDASYQNADGTLKLNYTITIRRIRPLTQTTDIRNQGGFFASTHEDTFDHLMMVDQQEQDAINRGIKLQTTEVGSAAKTTLPTATQRASKFFAWDASGNPIASTGGLSGVVAETMVRVINTRVALKALTAPTALVVYLVLGHTTVGDGGWQIARWNASDTTADNGGTITALDSGGIGRFNAL